MSAKVMDKKNRWRSKTVSFRVSPEEWADIERLVRLSGMSKQDYIMYRLQDKEINVNANPRVVKAMKQEINTVVNAIENADIDEEVLSAIKELVGVINQPSK